LLFLFYLKAQLNHNNHAPLQMSNYLFFLPVFLGKLSDTGNRVDLGKLAGTVFISTLESLIAPAIDIVSDTGTYFRGLKLSN